VTRCHPGTRRPAATGADLVARSVRIVAGARRTWLTMLGNGTWKRAENDEERRPRGAALIRAERTGGVLLSQGVSPQVPSALTGLTSVFGMGTGVTLSLWPPEISCQRVRRTRALQSKHERSIQALGRLVPVG
jgi:hypothetical protein